MTVAGVRTARSDGRSGSVGRSRRPVVVARATLACPPPPEFSAVVATGSIESPVLARRSDLHVARRLRRRDAMVGLGVLAATFGATVAVLDVFH
jgi:hypothetical protein